MPDALTYDPKPDMAELAAEIRLWAESGLTADIDPERDTPTLMDPVNVYAGKLARLLCGALKALRQTEALREKAFQEMRLRSGGQQRGMW